MVTVGPRTKKYCPECGAESYVDVWKPPKGYPINMRKFICSECTQEFFVIINDPEVLIRYDRQLGRK